MNNCITIYLMTIKGFQVLDYLINNNKIHLIKNVIIGKDEHLINDFSREIEDLCYLNNVQFYYKGNSFEEGSYSIAISWRWIIKTKSQLIVFHDSLLPKYRGFAPLVNALINFESKIGVTALYATENYDEGDIIDQEMIPVKYPITIKNAIDLITPLYSKICFKILNNLELNNKLITIKQNHKNASYSLWRDEEDYHIDWSMDSKNIEQFILSLGYPYKGAYSLIGDLKIRIESVKLENDIKIENRKPGKVIFVHNNEPIVICGKGLLRITKMLDNNNNIYTINKFRTRFK